ncbi:MAG TPA: hypothetical protein VIN56_05380 [Candidatus Dormibacteraeota bacterium]|jgi:hypothetical protein
MTAIASAEVFATSEMGQLQTVFYIALVGGVLVGFTLFLLAVGAVTLRRFLRRPGHRLLASLIAGALGLMFTFIAATSAALVYVLSHHA